jgi:hypothetical protein
MAVQTLKVKGREFVLLPKREYERMRAQIERQSEQDRGDMTEAKRRSREPSISLAEVRKRLRV